MGMLERGRRSHSSQNPGAVTLEDETTICCASDSSHFEFEQNFPRAVVSFCCYFIVGIHPCLLHAARSDIDFQDTSEQHGVGIASATKWTLRLLLQVIVQHRQLLSLPPFAESACTLWLLQATGFGPRIQT